jgi:hypothetical protein
MHASAQVPFTPAGISSLKGKDVCSLQGEFPEQLGVFLDGRKDHAVQYQQRDGVIAVFLLSKPTERCGVVDAVLDLTSVIKAGESPEFKCYTSHEGGTSWRKWGHVIGLANNDQGKKRFEKARLAWRVNVKEKRFDQMKTESVRCDTSGYAD